MNKQCPTCSHQMSDQEYIEYLEKEVARLGAELAAERAKFKWAPNTTWLPHKWSTEPVISCVTENGITRWVAKKEEKTNE